MTQFTLSGDGTALLWTGDGEYLRIEPWGANSVRVRSARMHPVDDTAWALRERPDPEGFSIDIDGEADTATVTNGEIVVKARARHWWNGCQGYEAFVCRLSFHRKDGTLLFEETGEGGSLNLRARTYRPITGGDHDVTVSFLAPKDEHLYGMGEYQQDTLDLKGCTLELAHRNSQASVPFVVSSAGYGFLWNNPAIGQVDFAANQTRWNARSSRQLDYWVTAGGTPAQIERQYADATGHAPVMPEWGLGFWQCKLRYWNQEQLLETVRGFKRRGIPLDLVVIDFFHWPRMGDFRFEDEFWPDPKAMCDELHAMGVKLMVSVWPQVALTSENYVELKSRNLLVRPERGEDIAMMAWEPCTFIDATNPATREYVWDKCRRNYADLGVDAFWLDEAEPEYGSYDFENWRYHAGPNEQVGNIYPVEYNRGFYEGQRDMGREGEIVNLTRCAWAGSQRYGALVWSGDVGSTFRDLKAQITCAIHMGMAGIPWFTTDMGGFHNGDIESEEFRELFIRWAQFSCFLPVMRNHGNRSLAAPEHTRDQMTPLDKAHEAILYEEGALKEMVRAKDGTPRFYSGADNEPWSMGEDVERILVKYIRIREAMRPYTRELFDQAHTEGQPLVRGLFYEFPDDPDAADINDEYMFGPDLLVAPVTRAGATSRTVYLPGGPDTTWTNLHDGTTHPGGTRTNADAPLDVIPVYARNNQHHNLTKTI
ncbi:glycosyl hydrolase [Bifidobacterium saguini DSM 23967]|uniref:Glycosyl hydrolase n=2 Tax=Bifidobacterium saguini TaxID=762210 RepID=A0A087DAS7_9BIFI|nr:TIM-barrel domain-containing protein [Bifidobacterium saguini]KFI92627.1 glycosyl hydrolase [Bifidobacterium saguini DSM 23967]QTB91639.1 glycoside hydrolase family 31 protein [Bifidobacterium saguini]